MMSLIDTPIEAISLHNSAIPPGLSLTVTLNLTRRCSAASPRSRHRPRIVVSMLPPDSMHTTLIEKEIVFSGKFLLTESRIVCW